MVKLRKPGILIIFVLAAVMIFTEALPIRTYGQVQPVADIEGKLEEISDEEKAVLKNLFTLLQDIEEMERQEAEITGEIERLQSEIGQLSKMIKDRQKDYDSQLNILEQVFVSYQRNGPASFLEIILSSDNLTSFLRNINIIRNLSRNMSELLKYLEEEKVKLSEQKDALEKNAALLEVKKEELKEPLARKLQLKAEQEAYLGSLVGEREYYQKQLDNLKQKWDEIKSIFPDILKEFKKIAEEDGIPLEDMNISLEFPAVKGTIYEKTFNNILSERTGLPDMIFHFKPGKIEMSIPDKYLILTGTFSIEQKNILKFVMREGSFYNMPLEAASIKELFRDGDLSIDFSKLAGDITLNSVKAMDGYIEFLFIPDFSQMW